MHTLRYVAAAGTLLTPMMVEIGPAVAYTARQASLQGYGIYTTSKGLPAGYGEGYYLPPPPPPPFYGYGYGYRPYGFWRQRFLRDY